MLLLICVCICATAEPMAPKASLSGHVTDASDKSPLVGVTIYIPELSLGTTTDENGNYVIADLPLKTITLQISYLGHQTIIKKITLATSFFTSKTHPNVCQIPDFPLK